MSARPEKAVQADRKRVEKIAIQFYDDCLKGIRFTLKRCEDRNQFTAELYRWKDTQRQKKMNLRNTSPATIIRALRFKGKIEQVSEGIVLVWNELTTRKSGTRGAKNREERAMEAARRVRDARQELEQNRDGISVDFITFQVAEDEVSRPQMKLSQDVTITNSSEISVTLKINNQIARLRGFTVNGPLDITLPSRKCHKIRVEYTPKMVGITRTIISFDFCSELSSFQPFTIVRYISVRCGDPDDNAILKPTSPYKKKKFIEKGTFQKPVYLEKGERTIRKQKGLVKKLPQYKLPEHIRLAIATKSTEDVMTSILYKDKAPPEEMQADLSSELSWKNYSEFFKTLLWIEEAQMRIDIKNYDMERVTMERRGRFYSLLIPGLAENRPSVLRGDTIKVSYDNNQGKCFAGVVEMIECEKAIIQFPGSFNDDFVDGLRFGVRFNFSTTNLRICHQALSRPNVKNMPLDQVLFPNSLDQDDRQLSQPLNIVKRINYRNSNLNVEQKAAVIGVLEAVGRPLPYLIFGPPGTGKTVTLVEAIVQTAKANSNSRILVCAPSNTATDVVVQRLAPYFRPSEMLRLLAFSRDKKNVPADVFPYSCFDESQNAFVTPSQKIIKKMKIVAVTLSSGGKLPNEGITGHFTHVFMDEAGHAIEPLALSCFAEVTKSSESVLVLAGDPKQLGPIIRSQVAKDYGLDKSLLERLCECKPYHRRILDHNHAKNTTQLYDKKIMTKLVRNYRSHPAILKLPNERFYDGDLLASADIFTMNSLINWEHLPRKGFPLIFHGVEGTDEREGNSPSWFNREEVQLVKEYAGLLVKGTRSNRVKPEEIAVITPYHKQAQKISMLLKSHNYGDIKVGSVDEFQGSERRVVIISTVRSSVEYMDFDARHQLGFLANAKRFNVAITRAQALLIVIGNPFVLEHDDNWSALIRHCTDNGAYKGVPYTAGRNKNVAADAGIESTISGIAAMSLRLECDNDEDSVLISNTTAQEGPAWRMEE